MSKRIYKVTHENGSKFLVKASTKGGAINHVAIKGFVAVVATQNDLVSLLPDGFEILEAGVPL